MTAFFAFLSGVLLTVGVGLRWHREKLRLQYETDFVSGYKRGKIDGLTLGRRQAKAEIDDNPLEHCPVCSVDTIHFGSQD